VKQFLALMALAITTSLSVSGCGEATTSRSEQVSFNDQGPTSVAECIDKLAKGGEIWGEGSVRATLVYDVTDLGLSGAKQFGKRSPNGNGELSITIHQGEALEGAVNDFLQRTPKGDTELFAADDLILLRINDDAASPFDAALRTGCERLRDGVTIRQYTFSRGNT